MNLDLVEVLSPDWLNLFNAHWTPSETHLILIAVRVFAVLVTVKFVYDYSKVKWNQSRHGRNVMTLSVSIALLAVSALVRDIFNWGLEWLPMTVTWLIVSFVIISRIVILHQDQSYARRKREETEDTTHSG